MSVKIQQKKISAAAGARTHDPPEARAGAQTHDPLKLPKCGPLFFTKVGPNPLLRFLKSGYGLQMTSEVAYDLGIVISDLIYLCWNVNLASKGFY